MDEVPQTTRLTLLIRLRDGRDKEAWSDFVELYSPVVYGFGRRQGLQDADAADLVQEVLRSVARSIPNYDRQKGRFRSWLMGVARNRLKEFWAGRATEAAGSGDTRVQQRMEQVPTREDAEDLWEQEYRRSVFRLAVERIRDGFTDSTWQAFWQTYVEGTSTREVAPRQSGEETVRGIATRADGRLRRSDSNVVQRRLRARRRRRTTQVHGHRPKDEGCPEETAPRASGKAPAPTG